MKLIMKIITIEEQQAPSLSALTNEAANVTFPLSAEDKEIIANMKDLLFAAQGVGLAAPQVDVRKKIALIYIPESASLLREDVRTYPMHVIINPKYTPLEQDDLAHDFEGCYSVKSVYGKVPRYKTIELQYQDEAGTHFKKQVSGFYARVLQHEIDHLNGLLITDRLTPKCPQGTFEEMLKIRRDELPEEKRKHFDKLIKQKGMVNDDKKEEQT